MAFVSASASDGAGSPSTAAQAHAAGHTLIVVVVLEGTGTVTGITNTAGDSFAFDVSGAPSSIAQILYYRCQSTIGHAADVITVATTGGPFVEVYCIEDDAIDAGAVLTSLFTNGTSTTGTLGPVTAANALLVGAIKETDAFYDFSTHWTTLTYRAQAAGNAAASVGTGEATGSASYSGTVGLGGTWTWIGGLAAYTRSSSTGPTISGQPSSITVPVGSTASLSVTASATGGGALAYQWKLNGTNVSTGSGGTTANYTTGTLALSDDGGSYTCVVTESGGSNDGPATSSAAIVNVGIRRVAVSAAVYTATGTPTTVSPTYPTTALPSGTSGKLVAIVGMKPATSGAGTCTTPAGWSLIGSIQAAGGYTGGGASAADTGNCDLYVYAIDDPGTTTGSLSITVNVGATNGVAWAWMARLAGPSGATWSIAMATGSDTSAGNVSITFSSDPGVTTGDYIIGAFCEPTDVTTPAQFSAEAFSQTGVTFGTVNEIEEPDTANNFDIGGFIIDCIATAGPSSAAPVMTATAGGTTTNVRGPGVFVRFRASVTTTSVSTNGGSAARRNMRINPVYRMSPCASGP